MASDSLTRHPAGDAEDAALTSPKERFAARLTRNDSAAHLRDKVIEAEIANLTRALNQFRTDDALVHAAGTIVSARRRFIIGSGKSLALATLLSWELSSALGQVLLIEDVTVRALDVLADVRATDVLVAFSFRRYRQHTLSVAEAFAEHGGAVIGITDRLQAPVANIAHTTVVAPTTSYSYADSPTSVAAVVHLLSTLATSSSKGARRRLAARESLSRQLRLHAE